MAYIKFRSKNNRDEESLSNIFFQRRGKKIPGKLKTFKVFSTSEEEETADVAGITFWNYPKNLPRSGQSINLTLTFTGDIDIINFGDNTGDNNIISGQTVRKVYTG